MSRRRTKTTSSRTVFYLITTHMVHIREATAWMRPTWSVRCANCQLCTKCRCFKFARVREHAPTRRRRVELCSMVICKVGWSDWSMLDGERQKLHKRFSKLLRQSRPEKLATVSEI